MSVRPSLATAAALALVGALAPARANANGAFPDSMAIFLPKDAPARVILATNFGLLLTDDDGATWDWVCEQAVAYYVPLYQLGAPPASDLYAITSDGLAVSRDGACTWTLASGLGRSFLVSDAFPSPVEPTRVLSIARATTATLTDALHASDDGGRTLGPVIWAAPRGRTIESVEVAASDARVVYLTTTSTGTPRRPLLHRSTDGGHTFTPIALDVVGARVALIAAIDPSDAAIVYLRVRRAPGETGDQLAIVDGDTARVALELDTQMSGFLRAASGALYALTLDRSFVSTDGETFTPFAPGLHLRALAERDAHLYAVADNFRDGFAVGVSTDGGETFRPLLRFDEIRGPLACAHVEDVCEVPWRELKVLFGIDQGPEPPPPPAELPDACTCVAPRARSPLLALALGLSVVAVARRSRARRATR
ncbi:hypothetical protein L6R52_11560 [Myxococcota bacterium]|nr:hypothetical protein [Myxococcota bacterium]